MNIFYFYADIYLEIAVFFFKFSTKINKLADKVIESFKASYLKN